MTGLRSLEPLEVALHGLDRLELGVPMGFGEMRMVPLLWSRSPSPTRTFLDLVTARERGFLQIGTDGSVGNHGAQAVFITPGEPLLLGDRRFESVRPLVIPPGSWPPSLMADAVRSCDGGSMSRTQGVHWDDDRQPGAVLLRSGRLDAVVFTACSRSAWRRIERRVTEAAGGTPVPQVGSGNELAAARRIFDAFRYASAECVDSRGEYVTCRVRAPEIQGWLVTHGPDDLIYLELESRHRLGAPAAQEVAASAS